VSLEQGVELGCPGLEQTLLGEQEVEAELVKINISF